MRISRSMSDQHKPEERVKIAQAECERLRKENVRLRAMLGVHDPVPEHPVPSAPGSTPTPLPFRSITEASDDREESCQRADSRAPSSTDGPMARAIGDLPWPAQWEYRTVRRRKERENLCS